MKIELMNDREKLFSFFSKNKSLYDYYIGDLDDFYFVHCKYYALSKNDEIKEVLLHYQPPDESYPTLLLFHEDLEKFKILFRTLLKEEKIPKIFYAHFSFSHHFFEEFKNLKIKKSYGKHYKMSFNFDHVDKLNIQSNPDFPIRRLSANDASIMKDFYEISYPEGWFSEYMLETGKFFGSFDISNGELVSISGIHVFSKKHSIATLGNIATHPNYRRRGIGTTCIVHLLKELIKDGISFIGLNVTESNTSAISIYRKLGFEKRYEFEEAVIALP